MKLALEALKKADAVIYSEYCGTNCEELQICEPAIKALEEALAKQEQGEPVAWLNPYGGVLQRLDTGLEKSTYTIPLYTAPQQRKPLTDETRNWIVATCPTPRHIIDAVERMHGIKE